MTMVLMKTIGLNILAGFAAFSSVLLVALALHTIHNLSIFLIGAFAILFLTGYVRAPALALNPWLNGVTISLGASIPLLLLGTAVGAEVYGLKGAALVLFLAAVSGSGAQSRTWWKADRTLAASTLSIALFTSIFLLGKFALPRLRAATAFQTSSKPAPSFTVTMLDGTPMSLESFKGHVVVLDFWGTWCAPCIAELPALSSIYERYRSNPDVIFVLVNSGLNGDTPEKVRSFTDKHHLQIPVALDATRAANSLGALILPSLIVLDRSGNIRVQNTGYQGPESLGTNLQREAEVLLHSK